MITATSRVEIIRVRVANCWIVRVEHDYEL
jgi:hypothetical protein